TTAKGSSAVVSLGKLGRVELLPGSTMKIRFSESSIGGSLDAGRAKITGPQGTSTRISIKNGEVVADGSVATAFSLSTDAGNSCLRVSTGFVELHAGTRIEKIAAGKSAAIRTPCPL